MMRAPAPIASCDHAWIGALNAANVTETGPLDAAALARLIGQAAYAGAIPDQAFLIALDERADHDSPNFLWFRAREPRFLYVDRIIVAQTARGGGLARTLYEDMFVFAAAQGYPLVCCEVNQDPPNPASDAFHARLGFSPCGSAALANGKTVRYLARRG